MSNHELGGLMLLMTALRSSALAHLRVFINELEPVIKLKVLAVYKDSLDAIYEDAQIRNWFVDNVTRLEECNCTLANYLNRNK